MKRILFPALILLFLVACGSDVEETPPVLVDVKVAVAGESDVSVVVRAPATVFPKEQANIAPRLTAPVLALLVGKGDSVIASQVLARLENKDLMAQRAEAAASLADAEASLAKASTGTLPTEMERARGDEAITAAAFNQTQRVYERRKQLFEQGAIPERDLLMSETELVQARTNHDVAVRASQILQGQSMERDLDIARSRVEQARGRLGFIDAQISYADVRSPFAGTVIEQFLFPGDMAKPDTPIFTVANLSVAVARAQVPEANASALRTGQPCSFLPSDAQETPLAGTVTVVNGAVDPVRRTVEVWCEVPNATSRVRSGVFGTAQIVTGVLKNAVVIPLSAVQFEEGSNRGFVLAVDENRKGARRAVSTAPAPAGMVAVLDGLHSGETVVTEGAYGLEDGTELRFQQGGKP